TAHQFGLGKETGIDLPNEVTGRVPDRQWKKNFWKANKASWCKQGKKGGTYVEQIAYEGCLEGDRMRAGDSVNYSIGQGDTLVTPIQMATIYSAISNGGTLFNPTVGKAIISADGKRVEEIAPKAHGRLPFDRKTRDEIDEALAGVATRGSAAWRFGGWPQDRIPMHAKTGTAEVYGKQTTSWFASYTKDYTIVMTISQGGTGSGASGPAVRKIYEAMYGLDLKGKQNLKKALMPQPATALPKIGPDGTIDAPKVRPYMPEKPPADTQVVAGGAAPHVRRD
ncbi:penicillin-binding transpeptidase domain-containing protein, partial [Streptomyces sp. SID3212]|uniref:penicillin-binding transpeptidase domain-containing protein n=1 Tax=Streptomyces sp. SID3212 TaxID=2690259 RepID=UPI0013CB197A